MYLLYLCIKKSQRSSTIGDGSPLTVTYSLLKCTTHVPFVLVQNTSQRASTIGDGSPLTVNYSLLKCTTHVPFVLVQNTSQRSSTIDDGLASAVSTIPFSDVLPMYLLYLCKTQVSGRQPSTTALPPQSQLFPSHMYYPSTCLCKTQVSGRQPSTTALPPQSQLFPSQMYYPSTFCTCAKHKSAVVNHRRRPCLRSLNYSLLRCTTQVPVPFVLVQNTSQRFLPLVSSQPSHLWLSAVRLSPACLPPSRSHRASPKASPSPPFFYFGDLLMGEN